MSVVSAGDCLLSVWFTGLKAWSSRNLFHNTFFTSQEETRLPKGLTATNLTEEMPKPSQKN